MASISDAVALNRISRIVGYKITKGNFQTETPNLPQRIAILGEANDDNQADLDVTPTIITSSKQAATIYGYGSPIYSIARILFPKQGAGVTVPVIVFPQLKASGATPKILDITPSGTATDNATHTLKIAGREGMDGFFYNFDVRIGDDEQIITDKIIDAVNNMLGSPVTATDNIYNAELTTKWSGLTADELTVEVNTNGNDCGLTYTFPVIQNGSGTPSVTAALDSFGSDWNTLVINGYGAESTTMDSLEEFNGVADPENPTGRYLGIVMKPFVALTGSSLEDPSSITDSRKDQMTIAICSTPLSKGMQYEAAANYCVLEARCAQDTPHLDVAGKFLPDMPTPDSIGAMSSYDERDIIVQKGASTVDLVKGQYLIMDFVTTYHPVGENPPHYRYVRNIMLDLNVRFSYYLLEQTNVVDHAIAADVDTVTAEKVIKPKQWKQLLNGLADDLAKRALIVDKAFMQNSITVGLSTSNPDRLESFFRYKRSGFARILSTTAEAGFNFGVLN